MRAGCFELLATACFEAQQSGEADAAIAIVLSVLRSQARPMRWRFLAALPDSLLAAPPKMHTKRPGAAAQTLARLLETLLGDLSAPPAEP